MGTQLPLPKKKGTVPPIFGPCFCGQTAEWIKMPLSTMVGLGPGNIVLDADPAPAKGHSPAPFCDPCLLRPNGWMDQDATWYEDRPRPRPHCVGWGLSSPSPKRAEAPFLAHVCCGQTAGWIKMPLGTMVGLSPGNIVLDGDPAPPPKNGTQPPIFGPCLL